MKDLSEELKYLIFGNSDSIYHTHKHLFICLLRKEGVVSHPELAFMTFITHSTIRRPAIREVSEDISERFGAESLVRISA